MCTRVDRDPLAPEAFRQGVASAAEGLVSGRVAPRVQGCLRVGRKRPCEHRGLNQQGLEGLAVRTAFLHGQRYPARWLRCGFGLAVTLALGDERDALVPGECESVVGEPADSEHYARRSHGRGMCGRKGLADEHDSSLANPSAGYSANGWTVLPAGGSPSGAQLSR